MEIAGATAVVTGAAVGAGRAIAEALAAEGARVVVSDVDEGRGVETVGRIRGAGGAAEFVAADVRRDDDVERLVTAAARDGAPLRVLVNNAGGGGHIPPHFPAATREQWSALLELNLRAAMVATQLALEPMRRGGGGAVVNVASTAGLGVDHHPSPEYSAAKAGLIRFTSCLAPLRGDYGVRVNCVVPDWIATERAMDELARMSPAERAGAPTPLPLPDLTAGVLRLVRDDELAGRILVLKGGTEPKLLRTED